MAKRFFGCVVAIVSIAAVAAVFTPAELVTDINQVPAPVDSHASVLCSDSSGTYLTGMPIFGRRGLWYAEGSSAQTRLLKDFGASAASTLYCRHMAPNGARYFEYYESREGAELWRTDGTLAGTFRLAGQPPATGGPIEFLGSSGASSVFILADEQHGRELFVTDGTLAGTRLLLDITPGPGSSDPRNPAFVRDRAYFQVGDQLWISDLTAAGTRLVHDFNGATGVSQSIGGFQAVPGGVVFAYGAGAQRELWFTNGDNETRRLATAAGQSLKQSATLPNGRVLFLFGSSGQLWSTDGTAAGTFLFDVRVAGSDESLSETFIVMGDRAVFAAYTVSTGTEAWATDGIDLTLLGDFTPGADSSQLRLRVRGSTVIPILRVVPPGNLLEIYVTDGTPAGTRHLTPLTGQAIAGNTYDAMSAGDSVYFWTPARWEFDTQAPVVTRTMWRYSIAGAALTPVRQMSSSEMVGSIGALHDGRFLFNADDPTLGIEPWVSDGTAAGTHVLASLAPEGQSAGSDPGALFPAGSSLMFRATDNLGRQGLWRTDGTAAGTVPVNDQPPSGPQPAGYPWYVSLGNRTLYTSSEVWITDGTVSGTQLVSDMSYSGPGSTPGSSVNYSSFPATCGGFVVHNGVAYYGVKHYSAGSLMRSDGTVGGTAIVQTLAGEARGGFPSPMVVCAFAAFNNRIFYCASSSVDGDQLRVFTPSGSVNSTLLNSSGRSLYQVARVVPFNNAIWFFATDTVDQGLWRSGGTDATTTLAIRQADLPAGTVIDLRATSDALYFVHCTSSLQVCQLSRTDGTLANTGTLAEVSSSHASFSGPASVIGNKIIFLGVTSAGGVEPWVTDGTVAGMQMLKDIRPGAGSSGANTLVSYNGFVYFFAQPDRHGPMTLWRTDGTPQNTEIANALPTGTFEYVDGPGRMAVLGQRMLLAARSDSSGTELYAVDNPAPAPPPAPPVTPPSTPQPQPPSSGGAGGGGSFDGLTLALLALLMLLGAGRTFTHLHHRSGWTRATGSHLRAPG